MAELTGALKHFAETIRDNAAIREFCVSRYGKRPTIQVGLDLKRPPKDVPIVVFYEASVERDLDAKPQAGFAVAWCIANEAVDETDGIRRYVGFDESDELGELIRTALAPVTAQYRVRIESYGVNATEWFPQFPGSLFMAIEWFDDLE